MAKTTYFGLIAICLMVFLIVNTEFQMAEAQRQSCGWRSTGDCCYRCGHKCLNLWRGSRHSNGNYWSCRRGTCFCYYGSC
ncbi:hypothetical protein BVRB_8g199890 [Beta vulgaris subsp. vulgaris]|uniref:Uncharacterized protein n=1 Tax=Beta vulgaris subsp. vulgaris TaxID=3555 RepID=A0A0J8BA78_BETVV|nr:hypothetical protein BVRB_8g199890 [Beta vulgaris subsp. vulgaris]